MLILQTLYFLNTNLLYSLIFIIIHLYCDILDGALARLQNSATRKGAFTDHVIDYSFFFLVLFGLMFFRYISPFIGAVYIVNYLLVLGFSVTLNTLKSDRLPYVFKSRWLIYLAFLILCFSGFNILDVVLMFFAMMMFFMNCLLFQRIRCSL